MEPVDPVPGSRPEQRRPLLMDPAGARPSGFAPPAAVTQQQGAQVAPAPPMPVTASVLAAPPAATAAPEVNASAATGGSAAASGGSAAAATGGIPRAATGLPGEASFGPVSQVVRVSVRTLSSRIDLVLPDRSTIAETLETVLELAPRSLREQAIAHGGWILRTAAGEAIPGSATLLDQGIVDGATLFLTGVDTGHSPAVYDDVADAIADTVLADPSVWPARGSRAVALGAAGLFGAIGCLAVLWAGPPWILIAVVVAGIALLGQAAAGLLSRRTGDTGAAMVAGLLSVAAGAAAATVATAGDAGVSDFGVGELLLGAAAAALLATSAALLIGTRQVVFEAIVTAASLVFMVLLGCAIFDLAPPAGAAITAALALGLMPLVPAVALALVRFELSPPPTTVEQEAADKDPIDAPALRQRAHWAVGHVTALVQGLAWPALAACVVLAFSRDVTAQVLAALVGVDLILRARLFLTIGQRLPLLLAGAGSLAAVLAAVTTGLAGVPALLAGGVPALLAVVGCLVVAGRRRRVSPSLTRAAEIIELAIAIAVVPLVAGVLGLFGFFRGLGG